MTMIEQGIVQPKSGLISWTVRVGRHWFHWRSLSPIPLFLLLLAGPAGYSWSGTQYSLLLFGILMAEGIRIWAVGYAGSRTRTRGDTVSQLVHAGPFRYVRNPLYIANILLYTLAGICFGNLSVSLLIFIFSCVEYHFIVAFEEHTLNQTFGPRYQECCSKVSRWLPSLSPMISSSEHIFDLRSALRSERSTFYSMLLMTAAFFIRRLFF